MRTLLIAAGLASLAYAGVAAAADTVSVTLPRDARQFGPGPGQALATANCTPCHAADYVYMQPPLTKDQWRAEVLKMKNAYGAVIPDDTVDPLVAYLVTQNGKQ